MPTREIKFKTQDEIINKRIFKYDTSLTIEDMLLDFLRETNSKMVLDPNQISFLFKALLINKKENLQKKVGEVFRSTHNIAINVIDTNFIIGGKYFIL